MGIERTRREAPALETASAATEATGQARQGENRKSSTIAQKPGETKQNSLHEQRMKEHTHLARRKSTRNAMRGRAGLRGARGRGHRRAKGAGAASSGSGRRQHGESAARASGDGGKGRGGEGLLLRLLERGQTGAPRGEATPRKRATKG